MFNGTKLPERFCIACTMETRLCQCDARVDALSVGNHFGSCGGELFSGMTNRVAHTTWSIIDE
jgi:hypothetical protein